MVQFTNMSVLLFTTDVIICMMASSRSRSPGCASKGNERDPLLPFLLVLQEIEADAVGDDDAVFCQTPASGRRHNGF